MEQAIPMQPRAKPAEGWWQLIWPKEHGSWSLALEPIALGLIAAPSAAGAGLAAAAAAGFFVRRPLRAAVCDRAPERKAAAARAALACAAAALLGLAAAIWAAGTSWLVWLLPSAAAGAVFAAFDLQKAGRDQQAEIAGAACFGWLPAVFAAAAGRPAGAAAALGAIMLARAVPTVATIRAVLRSRKTGERHFALPLLLSAAAVAAVGALSGRGEAPLAAAVAMVIFAVRSFVLLVYPRPAWRASQLGMAEAALGAAFVLAAGLAWTR